MRAGLFVLLAGTCAVQADSNSTGWFYRPWQSDEGLPDNAVTGVAQTPDGYLWVGTAGGLVRFNGASFEELPLVNLEGVPNRVVRAMMVDSRGRLWLQMDRGSVICLEPTAARVFTTADGLPDARATMIVEDGAGAIWLAFANGGIARIQNTVKLFTNKDGWPSGGACSVATDSKGELWFAKGRRLGVFREDKFQTLLNLPESTMRITRSHQGGLWICAGARLLKYQEGSEPEVRARLPQVPEDIEARALLEDRACAVWIGTVANGLFRFDGANLLPVPASYPEISCLTEDREGNLWLGTGGGGLNRLRPRTIDLLGSESGLPYESVRSICEDGNGAIWAATQNGLVARWDDGSWSTVSKGTNWPGGHPNCVAADRKGAVWLGTRERGLLRLHEGNFTSWRRTNGLASDSVRSLLPASTGDLWLSTDGPSRVQRLHDDSVRTLELPSRSRSIRALAEDAAGTIWVGTAEGRLYNIGSNLVVKETSNLTPRPLSIRCLQATPDGSLWIGYAGWGVGRLKAGRLARITVQQGLNDDYISQMVTDNRGQLWLAGNHGVFQVGLRELEDVIAGESERVRSILYGRSEGVPNLQANYENSPGALRSRDGRLWFPMHTGVAVVHTANIRDNTNPPPVLIERVAVDGHTVALYDSHSPLRERGGSSLLDLRVHGATLRLGPGHRRLDFDFTALSFTAMENVHCRYRLDEIDEDWTEALTQRSVNYSRLPAGHYRFRVQGCNNAGVWNETGATLSVIVNPFIWQTWWFRIGLLSGFTLGLIALVRYLSFQRLRLRLRELEAQAALHKERARIAKDIHDDLGANLTQIALLGELARQDQATPEKAGERTEKISTTARQAIKSLDEIVWAVNPRNDTLAHLVDYAGQFALDYLRLAGIRCRLDLPEQTPVREVSTDIRHNLFLAIKEALNNIVKHSRATEVWLRVNATSESLQIVVEDDGCGFAQGPEQPGADGLRNMAQRLAEIGGDCHIDSEPGTGTKVTFRLPWPKNQ